MDGLKEVDVLGVFQLLPVKVSHCKVRQQCDLGVCRIRSIAKENIDLANEIGLASAGELPTSDQHGFL